MNSQTVDPSIQQCAASSTPFIVIDRKMGTMLQNLINERRRMWKSDVYIQKEYCLGLYILRKFVHVSLEICKGNSCMYLHEYASLMPGIDAMNLEQSISDMLNLYPEQVLQPYCTHHSLFSQA